MTLAASQQLAKEILPQKKNPDLEHKLNAEPEKAADEIRCRKR